MINKHRIVGYLVSRIGSEWYGWPHNQLCCTFLVLGTKPCTEFSLNVQYDVCVGLTFEECLSLHNAKSSNSASTFTQFTLFVYFVICFVITQQM